MLLHGVFVGIQFKLCHVLYTQIVVDGVPLTAVTESFDITPSPPPTPTMGTEGDGVSGRDLVLILVVGGASTAIVLSIAIICVACCIRCHHGNKGKGNKKGTMSGRSSLSQLPRLRPTFKVPKKPN